MSVPDPLHSRGEDREVDLEKLDEAVARLRGALADFGIRFADAMSKVDWDSLRVNLEALKREDRSDD